MGAQVLFTPHLAPMNRGILATCYARPAAAVDNGVVLEVLREGYATSPSSSSGGGAVDEGDTGIQRRPRHGPLRRPHREGARCAPSTTSPRAPPAAPCRRPTSPSVSTRRRPPLGLTTVGLSGAMDHDGWNRADGRPRARRGAAVHPALRRANRSSSSTAGTRSPARRRHDALALFAEDIVLMRLGRHAPVVVHGGGPQISDLMARLGKARVPRRAAGHRRGDRRHRPHGADRPGQPPARHGDQRARPASRSA